MLTDVRSQMGAVALAIGLLVIVPASLPAQGMMDRIKKRAEQTTKRKIEDRVDRKVDQTVDKVLDTGENVISCVATDKKCIDDAKKAGKEVKIESTESAASSAETAPPKPSSGSAVAKPSAGTDVFKNFDFVPGSRVLFQEDFSTETVGNFPRRLKFKRGNMEVAESEGQRWITNTGGDGFEIVLSEPLPSRFTIEFDFVPSPSFTGHSSVGGGQCYHFHEINFKPTGFDGVQEPVEAGYPDMATQSIRFCGFRAGLGGEKMNATTLYPSILGKVNKVRVMGDGDYIKVYVNGTRVSNVPNSTLGRSRTVAIRTVGDQNEQKALFGNIRIAAGTKQIYDALVSDGRVATQGIYFDTGSDRIRPESAPTLKEIGDMLTQHAELKLTIEGHTDNVGAAASNQSLSDKRAAAVRQALIDQYAIDAARLVSKGLGASKPAAPNTTPEGRQQNRRVELVKM
jgi:OmpA-OmpF porin, OOP family